MKKKEREDYKRKRIRDLYVYAHKSLREIADILNNDHEFKRVCGHIAVPTVQYWVTKIKSELENAIGADAIEKYTAEYIRKMQFMDEEIDSISKMLESKSLKDDDRLKLMRFRHDVVKDELMMLQDHELPLAIKKMKNDRHKTVSNYTLIKDEEKPIPIEFKEVKQCEDSQASKQES